MLNKIIAWAQKEDAIRAAVLTGSRAHTKKKTDAFSDYDLALFVSDPTKLTTNDSWITALGSVWVSIPETIPFNEHQIPTRLIIFEHGIGADISLWPVNLLKIMVAEKKLPFACESGYRILLDKDGLAKNLIAAPEKRSACQKPTQKEFLAAIRVFFFEAFNCAKYLARGDLWHAKLRDWTTKEYLLKMIEWHEMAKHNWDYDTFWHGKNMHAWVSKETWTELHNCFAHFDAEDSWKALIATIELFGRIGKQTAEHIGYQYPTDVDKNITEFVQKIRHGRDENANNG